MKKATGVRVRQGAEEMSHVLEGSFEGWLVLLQHLWSAEDKLPGLLMMRRRAVLPGQASCIHKHQCAENSQCQSTLLFWKDSSQFQVYT